MININLNANSDWDRFRRVTEPELSDVQRPESTEPPDPTTEEEGTDGVEIDQEDMDRDLDARRRRSATDPEESDDQSGDSDYTPRSPIRPKEGAAYTDAGEPTDSARRGRVVDTDA